MEEEIRQIQTMLRKISFYDPRILSVIPDGIYGTSTEESVRSFQRNNNLLETGEVDNDTWDRIIEEYDRVIRENEKREPVFIIDELAIPIKVGDFSRSLYVIQAMMLALSEEFENLERVEITGIYDANTQREAEKIMIISGLEPKGELDREFINALSVLYNNFITRNNVRNATA